MAQNKMNEGEALALINHYGEMLARASGGLAGCTRADIIEWASRIAVLAKQMRGKNSEYLCDES